MTRKGTRSCKGAAAQQERSGSREDLQQGVVCSIENLMTEQIVKDVFSCVIWIIMRCIGRNSRTLECSSVTLDQHILQKM